ncbi:MAG TPA: OmpA family protein [Candidatus Kapabacteria bacterium]|nr:OmpA family protein [Candidatus Kapabacteria bacterium]
MAYVALLLLVVQTRVGAQEEGGVRNWRIEAGAAWEYTLHRTYIPVFKGSTDCGVFSSGSSHGAAAWAGIALPGLLGDRFGLAFRLGLAHGAGYLTATPLDAIIVSNSDSLPVRTVTSLQHQYRLNAEAMQARLDFMVEYAIADRLAVRLGPSIGLQYATELAQRDVLNGTSDIRFAGGEVTRAMTQGETLSPESVVLSAIASVHYGIPLGKRMLLEPEIGIRAGLTPMVNAFAWRSYVVDFGASLSLDMTHRDTLPPPPPAPVVKHADSSQSRAPVAVIPHAPRLRASLEIVGVDESGNRLPAATVRVFEVLHRERAALLESVYFDRSSSVIPARYRLLTEEHANRFTADSLTNLDPMSLHYHALNIIGMRLRALPSATLTLAGATSRGEAPALGRERARAVRSYFHDVWGIDTGRIQLSSAPAAATRERGEDQRAENRRVAIASNAASVLDPVIISRIERSYEPPLISIDPRFESDAGIKRWGIDLTYDGRLVGHISSSDTAAESRVSMNWQVDPNRVSVENAFLRAELTVDDSAGMSVSSRTQVPLVIDRKLRIVERTDGPKGREATTYSLLAFDNGSAELNAHNRGVIGEIAASTRSGAHITVVGYTDRTGSEEGNEVLSRRRAQAVVAALGSALKERRVRGVTIVATGEGYEEGRFDNELPEGRVLAREVDVILEQSAVGQ